MLLALAVAPLFVFSARASRPHIIAILADDQGHYDVGRANSSVSTPNIDALATYGVELTQHYVFCVCAPSRASFMSGRYPFHVAQELPEWQHGCNINYDLMPAMLKQAGYQTAHTGKWHCGIYAPQYTPYGRGFDRNFGFLGAISNVTHYDQWGGFTNVKNCVGHDLWTEKGPAIGRTGPFSAWLYGPAAVEFIEEHEPSVPLYLQVEFFVPHAPVNPPPPQQYMKEYAHIKDFSRRSYSGMVASLDEGVGNITKALKAKGMWDNTVLVFFSGNGGAVPAGGRNWPLRGCKWTNWEGGIRSRAVVSGGWVPASEHGRQHSGIFHVTDWYATFAALAGLSVANSKGPAPVDGFDLSKLLQNLSLPSPRNEVLIQGLGWHIGKADGAAEVASPWTGEGALRQGRYKVIVGVKRGMEFPGWYPAPEDSAEHAAAVATAVCGTVPPSAPGKVCWPDPCLFDVEADPCELQDLATEQPEVLRQLLARLHELSADPVPFDTCKGCSPKQACQVSKEKYSGFFGPYDPPFTSTLEEESLVV